MDLTYGRMIRDGINMDDMNGHNMSKKCKLEKPKHILYYLANGTNIL